MPQPVMLKNLKLNGSMKTYKTFLELTPPKDVLFIIGDWNVKVGSQEIPGSEVIQSCPTLCNLMDCSLPGSSAHGDSPGKNTGVDCRALLQGIFPTRNRTGISCIVDRFFRLSPQDSLKIGKD